MEHDDSLSAITGRTIVSKGPCTQEQDCMGHCSETVHGVAAGKDVPGVGVYLKGCIRAMARRQAARHAPPYVAASKRLCENWAFACPIEFRCVCSSQER